MQIDIIRETIANLFICLILLFTIFQIYLNHTDKVRQKNIKKVYDSAKLLLKHLKEGYLILLKKARVKSKTGQKKGVNENYER